LTAGVRRALPAPTPPRLEEDVEPRELGEAADGLEVTQSRLHDPDLGGARIRGLRLVDVAIERGNLANLVAPEALLSRVTIAGARLTGAQLTRARISDAALRDCRIDLATFAGATLERTTFADCRLEQAELRDALLRAVRFDRCDLTEADFTGVRIDGCELRDCTLTGATGLERLRGAAMPWADVLGNAGALAATLGIRVLED
jgi:uncharacterized protein YjbI with pentapeptide repeats